MEQYNNDLRASNVKDFLAKSAMFSEVLRPHQQNVFEDLIKFLEDDGSKGYIEMPTGTGKTVLYISILNALQAGTSRHRALIVTPTIDLVNQTVGEDFNKGFEKFAPGKQVGTYFSLTPKESKTMDQDTVVTTYASLNNLAKNNPLFLEDFSVVILDEAHHALGENTSKIIKQVSEETLVLGFTATPDYTEMKKLDSVLEKSIHSINLEEALREGLVATLVPVAIKTNNKISNIELNEFGEYMQDSMSGLMYDTTRNKIIIKLIQELKNHGIQAVVSCIPGQDFFHPKFLSELARKNNIKAQSITSDTPKLERAEMQKRFENGEIDALFYINVLSEGWDSQAARALINARPTRSKLLATQRIGRILRNKPENNYGLVIELLDKYNQLDAPPVLASDVLGYRLNSFQSYGKEDETTNLASLGPLEQDIASIFNIESEMDIESTNYDTQLEKLPPTFYGEVEIFESSLSSFRKFATAETLDYKHHIKMNQQIFEYIKSAGILDIEYVKMARTGKKVVKVYDIKLIKMWVNRLPEAVRQGHYLEKSSEPNVKYISQNDLYRACSHNANPTDNELELVNKLLTKYISNNPLQFTVCKDTTRTSMLGTDFKYHEPILYIPTYIAKQIISSVK